MTAPSDLPAELTARVTAFVARLRVRHAFLVGPGEAQDALRALGAVNILNRHEVRDALRTVLIASPEQGKIFDQEFYAFFQPAGSAPPPELPPLLPETPTPGQEEEVAPPSGQQREEEGEQPAPSERDTADDAQMGQARGQLQRESDSDPDDADGEVQTIQTRLSPNAGMGGEVQAGGDDLPELLRAASALIRAVQMGRSRRLRPQPRGPKLDARRTLHAAARTAGDATTLKWLGRPRRAPRFLLVLDGSRSMGKDATLLLRFAQALHLRSRRVEVFAFSTGLVRVTPYLRQSKPGQPLTLPDLGEAWGGGTRIGENLLKLARHERERVSRDTIVLILSDGLDTGDTADIERAMRDLKRRAGQVVWLSPLAALPGYQPVQRAVKAALPHLSALLPAGDVRDLHALPGRLRRQLNG